MYLNGLFSIFLAVKQDGAPALGAPVLPHHNVSLHPSQRLEQVLQVLPGIRKWYPLHHHLQHHIHAFMLVYMLCKASQETPKQTINLQNGQREGGLRLKGANCQHICMG